MAIIEWFPDGPKRYIVCDVQDTYDEHGMTLRLCPIDSAADTTVMKIGWDSLKELGTRAVTYSDRQPEYESEPISDDVECEDCLKAYPSEFFIAGGMYDGGTYRIVCPQCARVRWGRPFTKGSMAEELYGDFMDYLLIGE